MTRTTTLALCIGALIGFSASQLLPQAHATSPEALMKTEDGVIVFMVNGQEQARIDANGLHVRGDIAYAGTIADYGYEGFDKNAASAGGANAQK